MRGTPQQIIDKYNQLARDAQLSGDRVATENFQQHAEHYTRMLADAMREQEARREIQEAQHRERQQQRAARREEQQALPNGHRQQESAPERDADKPTLPDRDIEVIDITEDATGLVRDPRGSTDRWRTTPEVKTPD